MEAQLPECFGVLTCSRATGTFNSCTRACADSGVSVNLQPAAGNRLGAANSLFVFPVPSYHATTGVMAQRSRHLVGQLQHGMGEELLRATNGTRLQHRSSPPFNRNAPVELLCDELERALRGTGFNLLHSRHMRARECTAKGNTETKIVDYGSRRCGVVQGWEMCLHHVSWEYAVSGCRVAPSWLRVSTRVCACVSVCR